jgi:hypothetical protein
VKLLSDNYRWLFSEIRIRPPRFFQQLLARLHIPSVHELGLPDGWEYRPNQDNIEAWRKRLHETQLGNREPGPNLIDAFALDQIEQIAQVQERRPPILLTHSGKIFDALRTMRDTNPDFFRVRGVSLVQPPQMALVLRLRDDAAKTGKLEQVTAELARQQARGEALSDLLRAMKTDPVTGVVDTASSYEDFEKDLEDFEKNWDQWDALRQILQTLEGQEEAPGMLEGLHKILQDTNHVDGEEVERLLKQELDELIGEVDRLQGEIANRLSPPEAPGSTLELKNEHVQAIDTLVVRFRSAPSVPSAAYPIGSFRFRNPVIVGHLSPMAALLGQTKDHSGTADTQDRLRDMWLELRRLDLHDQPEFFLLFSVLYLAQGRWMQAYDMAHHGLALADGRNAAVDGRDDIAACGELLLARAGAGRAFVHAVRMDFPATCEAFLQNAIEDCLSSLRTQREAGSNQSDARCLREIAVILCSSHDPVYGPRTAYQPIRLAIKPEELAPWIAPDTLADPLVMASAFARKAFEQKKQGEHAETLYMNTHLYVMTEIDRRAIDNGAPAQYEEERIDLALQLTNRHGDDPNLLDTLMWHMFVLAERERKEGGASWKPSAVQANEVAARLDTYTDLRNNTNQYYQRLVQYHQVRVRRTLTETGRPPV